MTLSTEILTRSPLLDADDIEGEIGNIIHGTRRGPVIRAVPPSNDHPLPRGPMPDYVEHKEGVNQVGKLSAEAVIREYDAAVKEIEALGVELILAQPQRAEGRPPRGPQGAHGLVAHPPAPEVENTQAGQVR